MHKITVNGNKPFEDTREYAEEGEKVEVIFPAMTDVSMYVSSEETEITFDRYEEGRLFYTFVMPSCDVDVKTRIESTMMNRGAGVPLMGGSMMTMQGMMQGRKKFCSECGTPLSEEDKCCPTCGTKNND